VWRSPVTFAGARPAGEPIPAAFCVSCYAVCAAALIYPQGLHSTHRQLKKQDIALRLTSIFNERESQ